MVKSDLITKIANQHEHLSTKDVELGVNLILDKMSASLAQGVRIEVRGFGSFSLHFRPPRRAHNPKTGERVFTQAKYTPHFKPGKDLRERVNGSRLTTPIKVAVDDDADNSDDGSV
jgi:integration host factor subunit beta